jgi:ADP-heptose:LPS heptosyltransferase
MRSSRLQRRLDAMLGRPFINLVGRLKLPRQLPDAAQTISIIQPTAIGDTILGSGILTAIRTRYPNAEIEFLHGPSNAQAFQLIEGDFSTRLVSFTRPWQALGMLRKNSPDVVVDLTPWSRTTAICSMLSGTISVGFASEGQGRARAFDIAVPHRVDRHELDNLAALSQVFTPGRPYEMRLRKRYAAPSIQLPWEQLILCHAAPGGSQSQAKAWPVPYWGELTRRLVRDGFFVGFTGIDNDSELVSQILAASGSPTERAFSLCGRFTLVALAHVLQRARALITVDTAPAHLAAALGTPVIALHGPTKSWRWGPRSASASCIDSPHPCAGYISFGFEDHPLAHEIMARIDVEVVLLELRRLLEKIESQQPTTKVTVE